MTIPKRKRRKITVDGEQYHWVVQFERSGHVVVQHSSGRGSLLTIEPLAIMLPRHVAGAIHFALKLGWTPTHPGGDRWLGFEIIGEEPQFRRISVNTEISFDASSGRWVLPTAVDEI